MYIFATLWGLTIMTKSFHIYLEDRCLFKNLNQEEFDVVWNKIYKSYFQEDLTYSCCEGDKVEQMECSY